MNKFPIKGFKEGLLITIPDGDWKEMQENLIAQIDENSSFFDQAKIAIDVGKRQMRVTEISKLRDILFDRQIKLFAVLSTAKNTEDNSASLGLLTRTAILQETDSKLGTSLLAGEPGLFIRKTLRSGANIEYDGHVIVNGDVNPGAEIICSGSVYIWGKLRGSVSAGVKGSEAEVICAMNLDPINLRIANIELRNNKLIRKLKKKPVKVHIEDESILLDYWDL